MLKRRSRKLRPLSLSEQETLKKGKSDDLICPACWDTETFTQVMKYRDGYMCPIHKYQFYALPMAVIERSPEHRGVYEQYLIDRRKQNMTQKALQPYKPSSIMVDEKEKDKLVIRINKSLILSGANLGTFRDAATLALADMALVHGLNPFNGELWIIPKKGMVNKKPEIVGFSLAVGIKGLRRAARKISHFTINTKLSRVVNGSDNPDFIKTRGANICSDCNGVVGGECVECGGSGWWGEGQKKGCFKCGGNQQRKGTGIISCAKCGSTGRLSPEGILLAEVYLDRHDVFENTVLMNERAKKVGMDTTIEYSPFMGEAIWQPGDQFPTRRTPAWVATKNALRDVLTAAYELPFDLHSAFSYLPPTTGSPVGEAVDEGDIVEGTAYTMEDAIASDPEEEDDDDFTLTEEVSPVETDEPLLKILSGQEVFDLKKKVVVLGDSDLPNLLEDVFGPGAYNLTNITNFAAHNLLSALASEDDNAFDKCRKLTAKGLLW